MDNSLRWSKRILLGQFSRKQYPFTRRICCCIHNVLAPFDKLYQARNFHRRTLITAPHGAVPNFRICSASTCKYTANTHSYLKNIYHTHQVMCRSTQLAPSATAAKVVTRPNSWPEYPTSVAGNFSFKWLIYFKFKSPDGQG